MRNTLIYGLFLSNLMIMINCSSNKKIVSDKSNDYKINDTEASNDMIAKNFKKALLFNDEKNNINCSKTIKVGNSEELLDPINIEDFSLEPVSNEQKIWIKFQSLRMLNRCDKARPIKIIEIKKREE